MKTTSPHLTRNTTENSSDSEEISSSDISAHLLKERIIMLDGPIYRKSSSDIISKLLYLEAEDSSRDIKMYISSGDHSCSCMDSGMAIFDTMNHVKPDISTVCIGDAKSMSSILLAAGTKGKRSALPHSTIMIQQPSSFTYGSASDMEISTKEILRLRSMFNEIYSDLTGNDLEFIEQKTDRNCYMTPQEALEFGLIDKVIKPRKRAVGFAE